MPRNPILGLFSPKSPWKWSKSRSIEVPWKSWNFTSINKSTFLTIFRGLSGKITQASDSTEFFTSTCMSPKFFWVDCWGFWTHFARNCFDQKLFFVIRNLYRVFFILVTLYFGPLPAVLKLFLHLTPVLNSSGSGEHAKNKKFPGNLVNELQRLKSKKYKILSFWNFWSKIS